MLKTAFVAARDRARLAGIAAILLRYGAGSLAARLGLGGLLRMAGNARAPEQPGIAQMSEPERLRRAIEALGPTFIKLGQILATRADLLPPEWIAELETLQSHAAPVPWEEIAAQVEEDLGAPPEQVFARFDRAPLASASMAQIHRAALPGGAEVVVKIRRPGLRPRIEADLRLLAHVVEMAEAEWPGIARYRPGEILRHLSTALAEELDFVREARNAETVAEQLADQPEILIPATYPALSGERLLVQDYIDGIRPTDAAALAAAGLDGPTLARTGAGAFLRMVLVDGVFHADPHPGNLLALPGNRVAFLDFGMVGRLSPRRRDQLLVLVGAIVRGDAGGVGSILMGWAAEPPDPDRLDADAEAFIARHGQGPLQLGPALTEFMALARIHQIALPADLALLFKAMITADGVMRRLDPGFDIVALAGPLVRSRMRDRYSPAALKREGESLALELRGLAGEWPPLLRLLALRLKRGKLDASVELRGTDRLAGTLERAATRIAVALVVAAFALGLAPRLMEEGPRVWGFPLFGALGLVVVAAGVAWVALSGRSKPGGG